LKRVDEAVGSVDDEIEEELAQIDEDSDGARETFFRDPSGLLFRANHWLPSKQYWSMVRSRVWKDMAP
jgi:hypothetical protein